MAVAAVIVTYNRADVLVEALPRTLSEPFDAIIVVDNASTDRTQSVLSEFSDSRLQIMRLEENLGGAGGFHAGILAAMNIADWAVLYDDDSWPVAGSIKMFKSLDISSAVAVVSARVTYPDGKICEMNRQGMNPFWQLSGLPRILSKSGSGRSGFKLTDQQLGGRDSVEIDNASFVGFFLRIDAARRDGLPDPTLFIYGDDVLYSLMLRRRGWKILMEPAIGFIHDCGTMGEGFVYRPIWKVYYHCRNGVRIARAAAGPLVFPLALLYYVILWWRRGRRAENRRNYYRLMRKGIWDGLSGRFGRCDEIHRL